MIDLTRIKHEPLADLMCYVLRYCKDIEDLDLNMSKRDNSIWMTISFKFQNREHSVSAEMVLLLKRRFLTLLDDLGIK